MGRPPDRVRRRNVSRGRDGDWAWRTGVEYVWRSRKRGLSKNRMYHLVDQALNGLVSFTNLPMRLCLFGGLVLSLLSIAYACTAWGITSWLAMRRRRG
jgi:hypothetical protein